MHSIRVKHPKMGFSSAHFVISEGKCEALHGHNYTVELEIKGPLDELGMVLDFRQIKRDIAKICKILDHKVLLPGRSPSILVEEEEDAILVEVAGKKYSFPSIDCVILDLDATTAERLSQYISDQIVFADSPSYTVCVSESAGSVGCYSK